MTFKMNQEGKTVVLVVLHHTFDPDYIAPDSRHCVNNERVFVVDCLFHEDRGLLKCPRNDDAIRAVKEHLKIPEVDCSSSRGKSSTGSGDVDDGLNKPVAPVASQNNTFYVMVLGNTMDSHKTFLHDLTTSTKKLCEVSSLKDSEIIIAFIRIASHPVYDISAAVEILQGKAIVLVALHHTFDPDYIAPDSRHLVDNERVFAVDCLFHEGQGLLRCPRNDNAIRAVKKHLTGADMGVEF